MWSAILSVALALIYMMLVQCLPNFMNNGTVTISGVVLIATGILFLARFETQFIAAKIILASVSIVLGLIFLPAFFFSKSQLRINAIFLNQASIMLGQQPLLFAYIPLFFILVFGLINLTLFEFFSFWSIPNPQFRPDRVFNTVSGKGFVFLTVLVMVQLYWGLCFLRELCNLDVI
jgi:hypothetical protein